MKTALSQFRRHQANGSALITAAIAAAVLGIMVVSYLAWVTNEYRLSKRSHAWTQALNLCEAGVEVALSELNYPYRYGDAQAFAAANGWTAPVGFPNDRKKTVTGFTDSTGNVLGDFVVTVKSFATVYPTIECQGTATGVNNTNNITRLLRVVVQRQGYWRYALTGKQWINVHMNSKRLDSYNSTKTTESTGGLYDVAKATARANLASAGVSATSITVDHSDVYGGASTPVGGHVSFTAGTVGQTFVAAQRSSTEAAAETKGWVTHDFVMDFPDVVLPPEFATATSLGTISGNTTINSGDYRVTSINLGGGSTVVINGNVRLSVSGNTALGGSSQITIAPGATLQVYVAGSVDLSGNGVINGANVALNNIWYGLNGSTSWRIWSSTDFLGAVYAPYANVQMGGSAQFYGAFVGNTIDITPGGVHYDENLSVGTSPSLYKVLSWQPMVVRSGVWVIETN